MLKKRILQKNVDVSLLSNFQTELAIAYEDLNDYTSIPNRPSFFFEYASFFIKKNDDTVQYYLHVRNVVSINMEEFEDNYAIIRTIFCHQKNDYRFAFIIINWFENTNQTKLGCPVYRLQTINNEWKIFSISTIDTVNTVHFVHNCKNNECSEENHDLRNNLYFVGNWSRLVLQKLFVMNILTTNF